MTEFEGLETDHLQKKLDEANDRIEILELEKTELEDKIEEVLDLVSDLESQINDTGNIFKKIDRLR